MRVPGTRCLRILRFLLVANGFAYIFFPTIGVNWEKINPAFRWESGGTKNTDYEFMIVGMFAVQGLFAIRTATLSDLPTTLYYTEYLISSWFVHSAVMFVLAISSFPEKKHHVLPYGDVWILLMSSLSLLVPYVVARSVTPGYKICRTQCSCCDNVLHFQC